MQAKSDAQSLREYAERGSEAAFGELVARYTDLVYSAALRQVESPDLAQDVAQSVFTDLARKAKLLAGKFADDASLIGWLYRSTRFAALTLLRDDRRRQSRERHAMQNLDSASEAPPDWDRVRLVLDESMANLSDDDRDALLLRFFKNQEFRSVGAAFGVTDDAAQKRVTRALDKLRAELIRRGVTTTAAVLTATLSVKAVQVAPVGLAATLASTSLASAAAGASTTSTLFKFIAMTKLQAGIVGAIIVAGVATPLVLQHQAQAKLRAENEALRQQVEQLNPLIAETERLSNLAAQASGADPRSTTPSDELLRLRAEVTRLRNDPQRQAQLRTNAAPEANLSSGLLVRPDGSMFMTMPNGSLTNQFARPGSPFFEAAKQAKLQQPVQKLERLRAQLGLTDGQAQSISELWRNLVEAEYDPSISGRSPEERLALLNQLAIATEERIHGLLTPEQRVAYDQFKVDEQAIYDRASASQQVAELYNVVSGLTRAQQDHAFAALYGLTTQQPTQGTDTVQRRLKALEAVLTTSQLEKYRQYLETLHRRPTNQMSSQPGMLVPK